MMLLKEWRSSLSYCKFKNVRMMALLSLNNFKNSWIYVLKAFWIVFIMNACLISVGTMQGEGGYVHLLITILRITLGSLFLLASRSSVRAKNRDYFINHTPLIIKGLITGYINYCLVFLFHYLGFLILINFAFFSILLSLGIVIAWECFLIPFYCVFGDLGSLTFYSPLIIASVLFFIEIKREWSSFFKATGHAWCFTLRLYPVLFLLYSMIGIGGILLMSIMNLIRDNIFPFSEYVFRFLGFVSDTLGFLLFCYFISYMVTLWTLHVHERSDLYWPKPGI